MNRILKICIATLTLTGGFACWENPDHIYDEGDPLPTDTVLDSESETPTASETETENTSPGNSALGADWQGFGLGCASTSDCANYPAANPICIADSVMGMINVPGGYCSACCDQENVTDACGPGVDCVGANNAYLVCLARCNSNADCRVDEHYECRTIYYLDQTLHGRYCLPDEDHVTPPTTDFQFPSCPWPWAKK